MPDVPTRCWCNVCQRQTDHAVLNKASYATEDSGAEWKTVSFTLRCGGCGDVSLREEISGDLIDETDPILQTKPLRQWATTPDWVSKLDDLDPGLGELLEEVYSAANPRQIRLLSMGVRSAVDYIMNKIVGDIGSFEEKLEEMVLQGHLSLKEKEMLATVIDAGSATTHRGYKPSQENLEEMLTVMGGLIRSHYVTGPMLKAMKNTIPPRPPRPRKAKQPQQAAPKVVEAEKKE